MLWTRLQYKPGTRPNISETHSEISTRVPFCIETVAYPRPQFSSPLAPAAQDLKTATAMSAESRWAAHVSAVDEVMEGGIEVSGNHDLAKLVNSSFHTLAAA